MQNVATIYRFNTPFLNLRQEKGSLVSVKEAVGRYLRDEGLTVLENSEAGQDYFRITLESPQAVTIVIRYIREFRNEYHLPIFMIDVLFDRRYLSSEEGLKRTTLFLTGLFECFDGLNEKEFLIDIDHTIRFRSGFLSGRTPPHHDFSDIPTLQKEFESKDGMRLLEAFISHFRESGFVLDDANAPLYHRLHSIALYFIYLVFLMQGAITDSQIALQELGNLDRDDEQIRLMQARLEHVNDVSLVTFKRYREVLEAFFRLFPPPVA